MDDLHVLHVLLQGLQSVYVYSKSWYPARHKQLGKVLDLFLPTLHSVQFANSFSHSMHWISQVSCPNSYTLPVVIYTEFIGTP